MAATKPYFDDKYCKPCVRCGGERLVSEKWQEEVTNYAGVVTIVTHVETVCSDGKCQEEFELDMKQRREKRSAIEERKKERMAQLRLGTKNRKKEN